MLDKLLAFILALLALWVFWMCSVNALFFTHPAMVVSSYGYLLLYIVLSAIVYGVFVLVQWRQTGASIDDHYSTWSFIALVVVNLCYIAQTYIQPNTYLY